MPDHAASRVPASWLAMGMTVEAYRIDGSPALAWGGPLAPPANLEPEGASRLALSVVRSAASELGVLPRDLEVGATTAFEGWVTVSIDQMYEGARVPSGHVFVTFREGQLAVIRNDLVLHSQKAPSPRVSPADATARGLAAAQSVVASSMLVGAAALELWTSGDAPQDARWAYAVRTRSDAPRSELTVHVDASTGVILAADDDVRWSEGEGRVRIVVEAVEPGGQTAPFTVPFVDLGGTPTDEDGETLQSGTVQLTYDGPRVRIRDSAGQQVERHSVPFAGPYALYDQTASSLSQADPFVHLNLIKVFTEQYAPGLTWLGRRLTANVNINDTCNAFWDGSTVNFFRQGGGCNNTGRVASIVYHEFGHGLHQNLTNNVVGSVGEGTGDFLASTIMNDAIVGRGFSTNGSGIRRIDQDKRYPNDYVGQVHEDGLIWASALWDLREAMIAKHGEWAGLRTVNRMFIRALTQGPSLSTSYPSILSGDDDDNSPANGTPNSCEINTIFDAHGLLNGGAINHSAVPTRASVRVLHVPPGRFVPDADGVVLLDASAENRSTCGTFSVQDLVLHYAVGPEGGTWRELTATPVASGVQFRIDDVPVGGTFRYYLTIQASGVEFREGSERAPHVGLVDPGDEDIFRDGFEGSFGEWTHGSVGSDRHDDWEVGAPLGLAFDPYAARKGTSVVGTDLGAGGPPGGTNGAAKPGRRTFLESPLITTEGLESIRLELWQHYAINGTLQLWVDGTEVYRLVGDGSEWSGGWRFLTIALPETLADRADGFRVRFEVDANAGNALGGWSLDEVAITGVAIPPPPPPPPPEDPPPEKPTDPGPGPVNPPGMTPADPNTPPPTTPGAEMPNTPPGSPSFTGISRNELGGGCVCLQGPQRAAGPWMFALLAPLWILRVRRGRTRA